MSKGAIRFLRIGGSLLASNIGIACISYAGFRLGWWTDNTAWKLMLADGVWFCLGSFINIASLSMEY